MRRRTNKSQPETETPPGGRISELLGMQYGVWRRDICRYTGLFPVESMARQWIEDSSFPEHSEIHDINQLMEQRKMGKRFRSFYGIRKPAIPNNELGAYE